VHKRKKEFGETVVSLMPLSNLFKAGRIFLFEIFSSAIHIYFKTFPPEPEAAGSTTHLKKQQT
jgi:hypothetical protein